MFSNRFLCIEIMNLYVYLLISCSFWCFASYSLSVQTWGKGNGAMECLQRTVRWCRLKREYRPDTSLESNTLYEDPALLGCGWLRSCLTPFVTRHSEIRWLTDCLRLCTSVWSRPLPSPPMFHIQIHSYTIDLFSLDQRLAIFFFAHGSKSWITPALRCKQYQ